MGDALARMPENVSEKVMLSPTLGKGMFQVEGIENSKALR